MRCLAILAISPAALFASQDTAMTFLSTNAVPRSVFKAMETRDPFSPIGYVKPSPKQPGSTNSIEAVDFKIKVTGISNYGSESLATLETGEIIEPGESYKYKTKETTVEYKVLNITENTVVLLFAGKTYVFQLQEKSLESFQEKE